MSLHDASHGGEADAGARVVAVGVKALKRREQSIDIRHVEAGAVVAHEEDGLAIAALGADMNVRGMCSRSELPRVADQVVEQDAHESAVCIGNETRLDGRAELASDIAPAQLV